MKYFIFAIFFLIPVLASAQVNTISTRDIGVNWNKTTHVIFPASIKYFSSVSDYIVADKIDHILSIKANTEDFEGKSSLSVATADGQFYTFSVFYAPDLEVTNYFLPDYNAHTPQKLRINMKNDIHLLFPTPVNYIDYGNDIIEATPTPDLQNIVRVAAKGSFDYETNVSVALTDKFFYTFDIVYDDNETNFTYFVGDTIPDSPAILKKEDMTDITKRSITEEMAARGRRIFNLGLERNKIVFSVHNIFIREDKLLFKFEITNKSYIHYDIDYIKFYIVDKKKSAREASQELEMLPLFIDSFADSIDGRSDSIFTVGFEKFTIPDNKLFVIEINEKNGGRHIYQRLNNEDIINAEAL